ncbi:MAG: pyridoxamine 5'-phosphate oxidase family protein [Candidatus Promineifilaceae bacterium]
MNSLSESAPPFIEMAHRIVWATAVTVDSKGRPRSRILHPIWQWDGEQLVGWIATSPTPLKLAHLKKHPYMSINYWHPSHDTCLAECSAVLLQDDDTRKMVWDLFLNGPEPVGYNPTIVPAWTSPTADAFAAIKLDPWRLRVFPGTIMLGQGGTAYTWQAA